MSEEKDDSFLGCGWSFPVDFGGGVNPTQMVAKEEDIKQSLQIILSTRIGERIMRPDFGTDLHNMVYHNMDLTARTQLRAAIEKAILYWEPRIMLTNVTFDMSEDRNGILYILLEYTIRQTNARANMVYPFYYEEHF